MSTMSTRVPQPPYSLSARPHSHSTFQVSSASLHERGVFVQERPRTPSPTNTSRRRRSHQALMVPSSAVQVHRTSRQGFHEARQFRTTYGHQAPGSSIDARVLQCDGGHHLNPFLVCLISASDYLSSRSDHRAFAKCVRAHPALDDIPKPLIKSHPSTSIDMLKVPVQPYFRSLFLFALHSSTI